MSATNYTDVYTARFEWEGWQFEAIEDFYYDSTVTPPKFTQNDVITQPEKYRADVTQTAVDKK